jgi:hypothetical protein
MAETTPPPPKNNNTGFAVAAIVMLLLMGGLIYWKIGGAKEEAKAAPPPPPPPSNTAPVLENTLPPPPLEEDAGKPEEPKAGTKKVVGVGGGGGCAGECKGTPSGQFQSALRSKAGQARGCYERALRNNSTLQGRLNVSIRVGPQGQACNVSVSGNMGDPGIASCVSQMFRSGTYPPPQGGCVEAAVPLNFVPASK